MAESKSLVSRTLSSEFSFLREVQEKLRETWIQNIGEKDIKYKLLNKSDSAKSSLIPSKSLAKSALSTKFVRYEAQKSQLASVLDVMPKVLCFQRRNRDRCLPCMQKSLQKVDEAEDINLRSTLPTEIEAKDDSESSSNEFLEEFHKELQNILYSRKKKIIPRYPEKAEDVPIKATSSSHREEQEDTTISTKVDLNQFKGKTLKSTESLPFKSPKSLKATSSSISISSERSKISSSEAYTSDDEVSSPLALDNDPSLYKNMAPCHLPTILLPSMEPLRALKHKRPTTMESRIALMESATSAKEKSDEEYYDDVKTETAKDKPQSKMIGGKSEKITEKKDVKSQKALLKVKSEQLISPIVESPRKNELRRGYSCTSMKDLSKDSTRGTLEIPRREAEDGRVVVISLEEIDSVKESAPSGSIKAEMRAELPLLAVAEVAKFLEKPIRKDESAAIMLEMLANEFSSRVIKQHDASSTAAIRRAKLAARLTKLLADSKRYLSPDKFPSDLIFSAKQPPVCNSRLLRRILPLDSYNLVAPLLGMPTSYQKRTVPKVKSVVTVRYEDEETKSEIPFDSLMVHPPTSKDVSTSEDEHKVGRSRSNPYALFLKKPRRKVVTWRPLAAADLKGYDPEATLNMRARNITDRICHDFCQWLRGLGGTDKVDEEVLRDMFEIDFTADASRTMQMSMKEMPVVPDMVAAARQCPDASELAMTRKHLIRDAEAESKPAKTMAFGTAIPWEFQFIPPRNRVREMWLRCENVMPDLKTMDVVWKGITHLESVRAFAKWLREKHPEISPPDVLMKAMAEDPSKHVVVDDETLAHLESNVEQIGSFKVDATRENVIV